MDMEQRRQRRSRCRCRCHCSRRTTQSPSSQRLGVCTAGVLSEKSFLSSSLRVFFILLISCTKMVRKSDRVKFPSILLRGAPKGGEGGRPKGAGEEATTAASVRRRQRRRRRRQSSDRNSTLSDGLSLSVCVFVFASLIFVVFIIG